VSQDALHVQVCCDLCNQQQVETVAWWCPQGSTRPTALPCPGNGGSTPRVTDMRTAACCCASPALLRQGQLYVFSSVMVFHANLLAVIKVERIHFKVGWWVEGVGGVGWGGWVWQLHSWQSAAMHGLSRTACHAAAVEEPRRDSCPGRAESRVGKHAEAVGRRQQGHMSCRSPYYGQGQSRCALVNGRLHAATLQHGCAV
jgi:hypothetical protein